MTGCGIQCAAYNVPRTMPRTHVPMLHAKCSTLENVDDGSNPMHLVEYFCKTFSRSWRYRACGACAAASHGFSRACVGE